MQVFSYLHATHLLLEPLFFYLPRTMLECFTFLIIFFFAHPVQPHGLNMEPLPFIYGRRQDGQETFIYKYSSVCKLLFLE